MPHEPTIRSPEQCSREERADLESGFDRARHVLWTSDKRGLTGVAALKVPRKNYWTRVFADTSSGLLYREYPFEFGYLYVEEDRRDEGYRRALIQKTLSLAGGSGVFATTRETNTDFHPFLLKQGFKRIGQPYKSKRGDFNLLLFVRG